ncbi:hypothetical protein E2320_008148 [Naja naja]|nr:hypothetical protein E2320_008148 [Naja naja]
MTGCLFFRLILPYERYIKGEEDKPLPQVKPRKQEIAQEVESKIKLAGTKRIKHEPMKSKKEREEAPKPQDPAEGSSAKEKNQECPSQKSLLDLTAAEAMKLSAEGSPQAAPRVAFLEEEEPLADVSLVSLKP